MPKQTGKVFARIWHCVEFFEKRADLWIKQVDELQISLYNGNSGLRYRQQFCLTARQSSALRKRHPLVVRQWEVLLCACDALFRSGRAVIVSISSFMKS